METDVRRFPEPPGAEIDRPDGVLSRFDTLAPGESFALETPRDPAPELKALQEGRPGRFEWSPDLAGPAFWRITVTRRSDDAAQRTIAEALAWDHDRLEAIEKSAFAARDRGDLGEAGTRFAEFARGLARHIGFEEEILFPSFETATGHSPASGPTAVMRDEHRIILQLLTEIAAEIRDPEASPIDRRRSLAWVLGEHNAKEEAVLYPMTDAALGAQEADRLVRRIQAFRPHD